MPATRSAAIVNSTVFSQSDLRTMRKAANAATEMLKGLANDHRLMILCMLSEREMSVTEISQYIDLGQSPLSQHLARLRAEGLVQTRKVSQHVYYSLASEEARAVIGTLYELYCNPSSKRKSSR